MRTPLRFRRFGSSRCRRTRFVFSMAAALLLALSSASWAWASFYWANPQPTGNELGGVEFESAQIGYAAGGYGASLRTTDGGATWSPRNNPDALSPTLLDLLVLSPGTILAAGEAPGLFRSDDGGASWTPVANPFGGRLQNLFALDAATIFAVGNAGTVLRSTDGGATFTSLASTGTGTLVDQFWLDLLHGYVIGQARVRRTSDGGQTWSPVSGVAEAGVFFPGDVEFLDAMNGWILTDFDTYRTTNGGATWFELPMPFGQSPIYQEEGLILSNQVRIVGTEGEGAEIWKTTDDGGTWTKVLAYDGTRGVTDLERLDDGTIVASTTGGDLLWSSDDGDHWSNSTHVAGPPSRADLEVVEIGPGGTGFAGGWRSIWIGTTDGGRNWFDPPANPGLREVFALVMRDPLFILAGGVGTNGQSDVRRSTDGGASWTTHNLSASYAGYPQGLAALPGGTCFCATYGGTSVNYVFRSTDAGQTWHFRNNGVPVNLRLFDLQFLDAQNGFVCGGDGSGGANIYRTADGGGTWTPVGQSGLLIGTIQDMHWMTPSRGFVVGDSRVQRTTNGGSTWTTVATGPWRALDFRDSLYGVATELDEAIWFTTDGGDSWTRKPLPTGTILNDVAATLDGFLIAGSQNTLLGFGEATQAVELPQPQLSAPRLAVWPNPFVPAQSGAIHFSLEGAHAGATEARLFDAGGRMLARVALRPDDVGGRFDLSGFRLSSGALLVTCGNADGTRATAKIMVVR